MHVHLYISTNLHGARYTNSLAVRDKKDLGVQLQLSRIYGYCKPIVYPIKLAKQQIGYLIPGPWRWFTVVMAVVSPPKSTYTRRQGRRARACMDKTAISLAPRLSLAMRFRVREEPGNETS